VRADVDLLNTLTTYHVIGEGSDLLTFPTIGAGIEAFHADQGASH
jgi:hypothetical protein